MALSERGGRWRGIPVRLLDRLLAAQLRRAGLVDLRGHHVLARGLHQGSLVIDAGANRGEFSLAILDRFGCSVVALEPVPELYEAIPQREGLRKLRRALAAANGRRVLHLAANPEAASLDARLAAFSGSRGSLEVEACTLEEVVREAGRCPIDLVKLDIEGEEVPVLLDAPAELLRSAGQISVEFHDFQHGHVSPEAIAQVSRRLDALGFERLALSRPFGHHADTLFLNRRRNPLPAALRAQILALRHLTLPLRGSVERLRARSRRMDA